MTFSPYHRNLIIGPQNNNNNNNTQKGVFPWHTKAHTYTHKKQHTKKRYRIKKRYFRFAIVLSIDILFMWKINKRKLRENESEAACGYKIKIHLFFLLSSTPFSSFCILLYLHHPQYHLILPTFLLNYYFPCELRLCFDFLSVIFDMHICINIYNHYVCCNKQ